MLPLDPSEKAWHVRMQGPPIQEGVRCCVSGSLTDALVVNVTPVQSTCSTRPQDVSSPVFRTDLRSTAHLPQTALPPLGSCYFWNLLPFQACAFHYSCLCDCPWPNLTSWISAQLPNFIKIRPCVNPSLPHIPALLSLGDTQMWLEGSLFLTPTLKWNSKP